MITKENNNIFLFGDIEDNICKFTIPELSMFEKGKKGKIKFEIISDDLYFNVWQDTFEIISKVSIKIEEVMNETNKESKQKPKISLSETSVEEKPEPKKESVQPIVKKEENEPILEKEENKEENKEEKKKIFRKSEKSKNIIRFDSFTN